MRVAMSWFSVLQVDSLDAKPHKLCSISVSLRVWYVAVSGMRGRDRVWHTWRGHRARHPAPTDPGLARLTRSCPFVRLGRVILLNSIWISGHNGIRMLANKQPVLCVRVFNSLKCLRWFSHVFYNENIFMERLTECYPWAVSEWINMKFNNIQETTF